jgi:hypothetical protein
VTAVKRGKSIDTSMGLTPTGGVIHGHAERRSRSRRSGLSHAREEIRCRHA